MNAHAQFAMEMATSKRRRSVTEKKIEIIREIKKGKFQCRVAEIFELLKSTVGVIWKDHLPRVRCRGLDCCQVAVYCMWITSF